MRQPLIIFSSLLIAAGCGADPSETDELDTGAGGSASGGSSSTGGGGSSGGASSSGGSGGALGNTGGAGANSAGGAVGGGTGGINGGSGGMVGTGGMVGAGGAPDGSGGMMDMGTGGTEPGGSRPVTPSAGCGKPNPQTGSPNNPLNAGKLYYVKLPTNYDENEPYRVLFMFNPTGGGNTISWAEQNAGYENTGAKDNAIRVYPHEHSDPQVGSPGGWAGDDVASFAPLYDAIVNNFCVDTERVFAAGESSGGDFSGILGCEYGDKLRAVAPCATKNVNGYPLTGGMRDCKGDAAAVVIHGQNDNVVGTTNGPLLRDFYTRLNECSDMTEPVEGYTDSMSNCVMFTGCKEDDEVYWCWHTDPEYGGTNHGWPKFAAKMTWEVFESY